MKRFILSIGLLLTLAACGTASSGVGIFDPYEEANRRAYERTVKSDRKVIKPVSVAYGTTVPDPVRKSLSNVAGTLSLPGTVVNDVLQLNIEDAIHNSARFVLNATFGIAGLFDVATDAGIEPRDSNFGETLHVWGAEEGAFVMLPVVGPSTTRDAAGILVDLAIDPLGPVMNAAITPTRVGLYVADRTDTRYRYSDIYESVIYDSADGYAQFRLSYLDRRRFELGTQLTETPGAERSTSAYDLYEDFYE